MTAEVDIVNMALDRIGVDHTIESLDENNPRARAARRWYPHCRDAALSEAPWNWALRVVALAELVGTPPPGWSKQFRYPTDCLLLRDIVDEGGARWGLTEWVGSLYYANSYLVGRPRYPYEVRGEDVADTGKIILVDLDAPYALYVRKVFDPNQFDVQFVDALAWRLAIELGGTLKAQAELRAQAASAYATARASAWQRFLREGRPDRVPESPSITARI